MKITILGSGTPASQLTGIVNRYPPGFLVSAGGENILFECTEGIRFRLEQAGYDYADLKHLAISHAHADHSGALWPTVLAIYCKDIWDEVRVRTSRKNNQIEVYCPPQIAKDFENYRNFHLPGRRERDIPFPKLNFHAMNKPGEAEIAIGQARLSAFPAYHSFGEIEALAFRLEHEGKVFAYSGDTGVCDGLKKAAFSADLFICECSAGVGHPEAAFDYGHLTPRQAGEIALEAGVKKLVFFHYTGLDPDEAILADCRASGFEGEIAVGKDFQVFEI